MLHIVKTVGRPNGLWAIGGRTLCIVYAPFWSLTIVTGVLPLLFVVSWVRRARRRHPGVCIKCGYSLTGNISGICPECGTPVSPNALAAE